MALSKCKLCTIAYLKMYASTVALFKVHTVHNSASTDIFFWKCLYLKYILYAIAAYEDTVFENDFSEVYVCTIAHLRMHFRTSLCLRCILCTIPHLKISLNAQMASDIIKWYILRQEEGEQEDESEKEKKKKNSRRK